MAKNWSKPPRFWLFLVRNGLFSRFLGTIPEREKGDCRDNHPAQRRSVSLASRQAQKGPWRAVGCVRLLWRHWAGPDDRTRWRRHW